MEKYLELAISLASKYHKGQVDKNGHIYILHPLRVMMSVESIDCKIIAILHDTIEDTELKIEDLEKYDFPIHIIETIKLLTRDKSLSYFDYIQNIKTSELATIVKLADLKDNMRDGCPESLLTRYKKAYEILKK